MKTLIICMACSPCCHPVTPTNWNPFIEALPAICWGLMCILMLLFTLYFVLKFIVQPSKNHQHEIALKEKAFENEKYWNNEKKISADEELARKIKEYNDLTKVSADEELDRKIREYNDLTVHKGILHKITGSAAEIEDLKKAIGEMKKKYEKLDGEIEQIIIKKKG